MTTFFQIDNVKLQPTASDKNMKATNQDVQKYATCGDAALHRTTERFLSEKDNCKKQKILDFIQNLKRLHSYDLNKNPEDVLERKELGNFFEFIQHQSAQKIEQQRTKINALENKLQVVRANYMSTLLVFASTTGYTGAVGVENATLLETHAVQIIKDAKINVDMLQQIRRMTQVGFKDIPNSSNTPSMHLVRSIITHFSYILGP